MNISYGYRLYMTTVLRQRIVMAQSLTSLSGLALKSLAFILYLTFKRRHEINPFFLFTFVFMYSSFPHYVQNIRKPLFSTKMHSGVLPVLTVFRSSGSGSCSCGPHQILTLRPWSYLGIPRGKTHQVYSSLPPHSSSVALEGRSPSGSPSYHGPFVSIVP